MRSVHGALAGILLCSVAWACATPETGDRSDDRQGEVLTRGEHAAEPAPRDAIESSVESRTESRIVIDPASVNLEVERAWKAGLHWPRRAFDVALRAAGDLDAKSVRVELEREGAEGSAASVVVEQVGLLDDAVGGVRDEIDLALQPDGSWRVVTHRRSVLCPRGPHPTTWIDGPCP